MLDFLTIFNPKFSKDEFDTHKQLLLYHTFQEGQEYSSNEKLSQIGIIQAVWSFSKSFENSNGVERNVIGLEDKKIYSLLVEGEFFVSLACSSSEKEMVGVENHYFSNLCRCYDTFVLHHGLWKSFANQHDLTDRLNEHFIPFWKDVDLLPHLLISNGLLDFWSSGFKVADLADCENASKWETDMTQQVLLDDTSFLGLKDALIYHLPPQTAHKGFKNYGFVRNFTTDFDSLPQISNWIHQMNTVYGRLSSHVIAGNAHLKGVAVEEGEEDDHGANVSPADLQTSIISHSKNVLHNLTLPISFAYDTIQEVGNMTGVSNSMSLLTSYIPDWSWYSQSSGSASGFKSRSGFLISPLSPAFLPDSYKVKQLHLSFHGQSDIYNTIFWYYDDILVVLIFKPDFAKIRDREYLNDLSYKLSLISKELYETQLIPDTSHTDDFCYALYTKSSSQIRSSFPLCQMSDSEDASALELAVNGLDQFLTASINRKSSVATITVDHTPFAAEDDGTGSAWGLGLMGQFLQPRKPNDNKKTVADTFLDSMPFEKLSQLHQDVMLFLHALRTTKKASDVREEKLIRLNNGVLCFISEDIEKVAVVVENWFNPKHKFKPNSCESSGLIDQMKLEARKWYNNNAS